VKVYLVTNDKQDHSSVWTSYDLALKHAQEVAKIYMEATKAETRTKVDRVEAVEEFTTVVVQRRTFNRKANPVWTNLKHWYVRELELQGGAVDALAGLVE
jgi:hypothetical protein